MQKNPELPLPSSTTLPSSVAIYTISSQYEQKACATKHPQPWIALAPEHSGAALGILWWLQVVGDQAPLSILDCGASAALAQQALNAGIGWVICRTTSAQIKALSSAPSWTGRILNQRPNSLPFSSSQP
ncbi:hypothetical protein [Neokomagataea thailandica]|uniref:hypothetical protein n=1 Tax=Neokomagataea TaxID=1223423 RepID=UPI00083468F5|nr:MULTISPECIES: hypothetical protein [Neokomagataea]